MFAILVLLLMIPFKAIANGNRSDIMVYEQISTDDILLKKGLQLTRYMYRLAETSTYVEAITSSEHVNEIINGIKGQNINIPCKVFSISNIDSAFYASSYFSRLLTSIPSDIRKYVENKVLASIPSLLNGKSAHNIAATSMLIADDVFICDRVDRPILYLYIYNGNCHSIVTFIPNESHIVKASACFIIDSDMNQLKSIDNVKAYLEEKLVVNGIKVEQEQLHND